MYSHVHTSLLHVSMCICWNLVVWTIQPVQLADTVTRLWIRKGCLKVEEGLEHFKAMLTSKLANAKSALCKWTASTPKNPRTEDNSTVLSIHWRYSSQALVWVYTHTFKFKWTNSNRNDMKCCHTHTFLLMFIIDSIVF